MYKPDAEGPRSPILRAFWRLQKSRRLDKGRPSVKQQEIKCAEVRVSRIDTLTIESFFDYTISVR